ncbi:MAG TPA: hypothetical protein VMS84_10870 [Mycobacterium sp.]|jgi:hypothetical protein|nr:hypothetical protein [Mycobacterium sp.]
MAFTVVFSNGEPRDYGAFDSYEVTDAGVLVIQMQRGDVNRHYVAPHGWLEVVEMAEGQPITMSRGIMGYRPR